MKKFEFFGASRATRQRHFKTSSTGDENGGNRNMFRRHLCSGITFDLITFYSLLAIFNDSSETIRTKGMKDQLCAIYLASVVAFLVAWRGNFRRLKKKTKLKFLFYCGNFKVHFLPSSHRPIILLYFLWKIAM